MHSYVWWYINNIEKCICLKTAVSRSLICSHVFVLQGRVYRQTKHMEQQLLDLKNCLLFKTFGKRIILNKSATFRVLDTKIEEHQNNICRGKCNSSQLDYLSNRDIIKYKRLQV